MSLEVFSDEGDTLDFENALDCCPRCAAEVEDTGYDTCRCPDCRWTGMREQTVTRLPDREHDEPSYVVDGDPVG